MEIIYNEGFQYIRYKEGKANIIFFTAHNNADFNMMSQGFKENINKVKRIFNLEEIGYSKQIHSSIINIHDGNVRCGDAIITDKKENGIGIFTADCVPVLLYDSKKEVCAAVHSGWKGTFSKITCNTIENMLQQFGCDAKNITAYIGPHIRNCCYEVGDELIEKFKSETSYKGYSIVTGRKLDLTKCIKLQCIEAGIKEDKVYDTNLCTGCSDESKGIMLHSYRKMKENSGRLFSLIYMKD